MDASTMEETIKEHVSCKERSNAWSELNDSRNLTREQEKHCEAIIESMAIEIAAFEALQNKEKSKQCNITDSDEESEDGDLSLKEINDTQEEKCMEERRVLRDILAREKKKDAEKDAHEEKEEETENFVQSWEKICKANEKSRKHTRC